VGTPSQLHAVPSPVSLVAPSPPSTLKTISKKSDDHGAESFRPEPDTKDVSVASGYPSATQQTPSAASKVGSTKKVLKPTSSCYYYQEKPQLVFDLQMDQKTMSATGQKSAMNFDDFAADTTQNRDKMSLNLEGSAVIDESTKSAKNFVATSKRKHNQDEMKSQLADNLSRDPSDMSNINLPKMESHHGLDSPQSNNSQSSDNSTTGKREKAPWNANHSEQLFFQMGGPDERGMKHDQKASYRKNGNSQKIPTSKKKGQQGNINRNIPVGNSTKGFMSSSSQHPEFLHSPKDDPFPKAEESPPEPVLTSSVSQSHKGKSDYGIALTDKPQQDKKKKKNHKPKKQQ
jgi:hypothetical protein